MRRAALALVLLAACGGSSSSTTTTPTTRPPDGTASGSAPELLGRAVWDGPLTDPMALRALDRVRTALADKPPVLEGADPRMWLGPVQGWIERRVNLTREVRADADALATDRDPRMQLLATIIVGVAMNDFVNDLVTLEPPPEFTIGDNSAETKTVFREALEKQATPITAGARAMLQRCVTAAPAAPAPMRAWEEYCRVHDATLGELEARVAARGAAPPKKARPTPPPLFADCDTDEVRHVDPEAFPPDMKAKPVVAYIYSGDEVTGADVQKLEQAVAAKLGLEVGMPVVDDKELAAARKLVTQKKLHAKGPVCGQAAPLPAVVQHKRRHLIVGDIQTTCIWKGKTETCGLRVEYERAGSDDRTGLPQTVFARVTNRDVPAGDWIAAADRLAVDEGVADLLGGGFGMESPIFLQLAKYSDDEPWLRVASTLDDDLRQRIAACVDAPASFDATFTISPTGKTQKATLAPVTAPPADSKVTACVQKALEATGWPCPRGGKPAKVTVRMCVAPNPR